MLGGYYSQQQFLRNLDIKANLATPDQASVMDESYKEFVMQLASWDTRRDFWSQTDYYKQRMVGNSKADAALLDDLINNIQFMPGDVLRNVSDSVKLIAETAPDANNLLRQYVAFASQRAASHLNDELKGASGCAHYPDESAGQTPRKRSLRPSSPVACIILSRR